MADQPNQNQQTTPPPLLPKQSPQKVAGNNVITIKPQSGFQEKFLSSPADIVIGGGAAGAGKTHALLIDPLRYKDVDGFGAVIFRRTTPQIRNQGGLWDTSSEIYSWLGGKPKESTLEWDFEKSSIKMQHLEYEKNVYDHQGAQYPWIGFDELTHFTKKQFFYLMTRNRSLCGVRPCIRATCNPDPDSWVAEFIEWWIDQETGFPIPERDGVLRYFTVDDGKIIWGDSPEEVIAACPHIFDAVTEIDPLEMIKSATFIFGNIYHNKLLIKRNPQYLANLMAQNPVDKSRLLEGNWKLKQDDMSLCDFVRVNDLFTNYVLDFEQDDKGLWKLDQKGQKIMKPYPKRITCDVARFGRDLTVIMGWIGYQVKYIWVWTKSATTLVVSDIEKMRSLLLCGKSDVVVDQDGVGGGVVDQGGYNGFSGGHNVMEDPTTKIKENYFNLKTQCYYRFAERKINEGLVGFQGVNIMVDGKPALEVKIGKNVFEVHKLIKADLRCFKRLADNNDGKKQMNDKTAQKNILDGRSPDFGDAIMLREFFELQKPPGSIRLM